MPGDPATIWTVGHSTRTREEFLALLGEYRIEAISDVRRFPGARHHQQIGRDALALALEGRGIAYSHHPSLGGRRSPRPDSPNGAWRNAGFRGYADYMATPEFTDALERLLDVARAEPTAIMCAEAVPWRCHRSMIADALVARGVPVRHILDARTEPHRLTSFAVVRDGGIVYPPEQGEL